MPEWDMKTNFVSSKGYFTVYSNSYDGELRDYVLPFNTKNDNSYLSRISSYYKDVLENVINTNDEEEYNLIGLNSNSFTSDNTHHNIFLEWDNNMYIPDMKKLKTLGGTIIKTSNGFHLLKEADILWEELRNMMEEWGCCRGYSSYSDRRKHACLRVCPKGNNRLKIIQKEDSFLYEIYEQIVTKLEEIHNGVLSP